MEEKKVRRNLYRVLRKTGVGKNDIQPEATYNSDLNFDLVDWKIFTFFLEGVFNISVHDEELHKLRSVSDTVNFLKHSA